MRLRDWRPQAEVIAPWVVRQQMIAEAEQELNQYQGRDG
jgi:CRISPR-associated protein (TIGR03985 family)